MFNAQKLFRKRLSAHIREINRYMRYILNGHTAIALVFLISVLAVYYQQWLAQLSPNFPAPIIIAVIFSLLATYTPINTLLKQPDLVFLTVTEHKMTVYFRRAIIYSYVVQLYLVFFVVAALGPLYFHAFPDRSGKIYLMTLVVLLIIKIWNVASDWFLLNVSQSVVRISNQIVRFLLGVTLFYFLIKNEIILASVCTILLLITFFINYVSAKKGIGIHWELLVERDQNRMQSFYRMASMFVDVPHLKSRLKKRKLLTSFVKKFIPFMKGKTYDYLYRLTFLRSGDYLQMYVRLTVIGSLLIFFVPNSWLKITFVLLFIYMSNFQMISLFHHHRLIVWLDLYPIQFIARKRAFLKLVSTLTAIQTVVFSFIFLLQFDLLFMILALVIGTIFNVLFNYRYVNKKLKG